MFAVFVLLAVCARDARRACDLLITMKMHIVVPKSDTLGVMFSVFARPRRKEHVVYNTSSWIRDSLTHKQQHARSTC